jgi:2-oxoisovalerate dehydrogenase E2 component (dihydrolipoyl transacylase)
MGDHVDFLVPDLGEGLEEATVLTWLVAVGDHVELNEVLCTVETAKAEVDVPSPYDGVVTALGGAEGDTLEVGAVLVSLEVAAGTAPPPPARTARREVATAPATSRQPTLVGYGADTSLDRSRRESWSRPVREPGAGPAAARRVEIPLHALAKPPVRKLARELGVDLQSLAPGSGPRGIVTRSEVLAAAQGLLMRATGPRVGVERPVDLSAVEVLPVRGIRARIADRMSASHATIPSAICEVTVDCERLLEVRVGLVRALEARGEAAPITPFSLICTCLVRTLRQHPTFNSTFRADRSEIHQHRALHLGVSTATDRGLLVAVVRDADTLTPAQMGAEIRRLALAARDGSIGPSELVGSTFTVSNFGGLGLDDGFPMINHPEAAIVGVGAVRQRPYVVDGELAVRHTANLTLAFDHRVGDGAEAAALLGTLRDMIEAPPEDLDPA